MPQKGYFSKFPKIQYPYKGKLVTGSDNQYVDYIDVVDFTVRLGFENSVFNNKLAFQNYAWKDEDRIDLIAYYYYGNSKYHWVVMLSSAIFDWGYDLPLKQDELNEYVLDKWAGETINGVTISSEPTLQELQDTIHHYDVDGYIVDLNTYTSSTSLDKQVISVYEYEQLENESRRDIKLLDRKYLSLLQLEFEDKLKKIKVARSKNKIETSL
jgi:hypothetical protein